MGEWRSGKCDSCLEDGSSEEVGTVGAEFGAGKFNWQLQTVRDEVERRPGNVVLERVRVRNLLSDWDLNFNGGNGKRGMGKRKRRMGT